MAAYCKAIALYLLSCVFLVLLQTQAASLNLRNSNKGHHSKKPDIKTNLTSCNLYSGSWIHDDTYPMYQYSNCPIIDPEFNCQLYGRPDSDYLKYKWKPATCELPRFNGLDFLVKMRGKTVMFVGDSLGRNQWQSLACMISAAVPKSPTQVIATDPLSTVNFLEYGVSISFYRTPYLVDINLAQGKHILLLDVITDGANAWKSADVLSFNSGHWWVHKGYDQQGWDYMEAGGTLYQDMDRLAAFERGMRTWSRWVDANIDTTKTRVFFQGISPIHTNAAEWKSSGTSKNCYGETSPVPGSWYPGRYPDQGRVLQNVIRDMTTSTYLLDITTLSQLRKDGHPSLYSGSLSQQQRGDPRMADCSHWCLSGLPDTWNQLFYTSLFF
ncbi:hypothetical protein ACHQM5_013620 [Ranunculus cassubicifolius]